MFPLRAFDGWLKQVDSEDLTDLQRLAIQLIFPHLAPPSRDAVDRRIQELRASDAADHVIGQYVNKRRFAGDFTLSAKRYFTLAHGQNGNDYGTLVTELGAYYDDNVGPIELHDFVTEEQAATYDVQYQVQSLLIRLQGTRGSNAAIAQLGTTAVWIPYRVLQFQIANVIDLRHPEVQEWFWVEFADIHTSVIGQMRKHLRPGVDPSTVELPRYIRPASFFEMLPVLMDPTRGGNGVTDHVGQWMRREKVAALIYPSARTPAGVTWRQNTIANFSGWNLVDYRGLEHQFMDGLTVFLGTDPWIAQYADLFVLEAGEQGSWTMSPPAGRWKSVETPVSDHDLTVRYRAGKTVFTGLIDVAFNVSHNEELPWIEAMLAACETPVGRRILDWMGIRSVHDVEFGVDTAERTILFECSTTRSTSGRVSKGYACFAAPPARTFQSLDAEPEDYEPDVPVFRELEEGIYIYYRRVSAA